MVNKTEQQMKEFAKYSMMVNPQPHAQQFMKLFVMKGDKLVVNGINVDTVPLSKLDKFKRDGCLVETRLDDQAYNAACAAYEDEKHAKMQQFKHDLFAANNVGSTQRVELLFSKCWKSKGDAGSGFKAVAEMFEYLVDVAR
jgi:hypothetical protein